MKLNKLMKGIKFEGKIDSRVISCIVHDSRKVKDNSLFIAIEGESSNGYEYIADAIKKGATAIVANGREVADVSVPVIRVNNTRIAMSKIASNFFGNPSKRLKITGITGTNGKTSTCLLASHILNENNITAGSLGTLGFGTPTGLVSTGFTTPESVDLHQMLNILLNGGIENAVMEISSHAIGYHRSKDVDVDIAVFTNLSSDHLDYHKTIENYFNVKKQLFSSLKESGTSIVNIDDEYASKIIDSTNSLVITYAIDKKADICILDYKLSIYGSECAVSIFGEKYNLKTSLIGKFNLYNVLAAISISKKYQVSNEKIISSIESFKKIPGRMEIVKGDKGGFAVVDYAHTPDAYHKILTTIKEISNKKIILIFGCGGQRDNKKRPQMGKIASTLSDFMFITSDNPRSEDVNEINKQILSGIDSENFIIENDRPIAISKAIDMMTEEHILVILGKGCDEYQFIKNNILKHSDLDIIRNNIYAF